MASVWGGPASLYGIPMLTQRAGNVPSCASPCKPVTPGSEGLMLWSAQNQTLAGLGLTADFQQLTVNSFSSPAMTNHVDGSGR